MMRRDMLGAIGGLAISGATNTAAAGNDKPAGPHQLKERHRQTNTATSAWTGFLELLADADKITEQLSDPHDERLCLEAYAHLLMSLGQGFAFNFASDPDFPHFTPNFHWPNPSLGNCPDTTYYYTPINPKGSYRVWGRRNNMHMVDFQLGDVLWGTEGGGNNKALASYDLKDFPNLPDGDFEFILSTERPAGLTAEWRLLPAGAHTLTVRQVAYDWSNEKQATLHIVRLDAPTSTPRRHSAEDYKKALRATAIYAKRITDQFTRYPKMLRDGGYINAKVHPNDFSDVGGLSDQMYYDGVFDLKDDEALILEMPIPSVCRYWNLQLINEFLAGTDYIFRHGSLNGHQARVDRDGKCRVVIAHRDPGAINWLDTAGLNTGLYMGRWKGANAHPLPVLTKIRSADIDQYLPADTVRVTPQQRADIVLARRIAMLERIGH